MRDSIKILFILFLIVTCCDSCLVLKRSKGRSTINFIRNNTVFIKECAAFSIALTLDEKKKDFIISDIKDRKVRNKMASLGYSVDVTYNNGSYVETRDSVVIFESSSLFLGITEIIYDFAFNKRDIPVSGSPKSEYYFIKVAERIYYRRRPIPMM